jgi:6-phospho-beta-glucosidase
LSEKIVFLGGGSPFIPSLIRAIIENQDVLAGSEVCLMDIDPTRLPELTELGEAMAQRAGTILAFTHTSDAREALEGATFVFPGYRVGGIEAKRQDNVIPTKHGICGDETAGPGGTFMAQCTIPTTLRYCQIIEELCPDAWVISYVNPTNFVADAVRRETQIKFVAICDCFAGFAMRSLPTWLDLPQSAIKARAIGVNHLTWLVDLLVEGQDGYPLLKERLGQIDVPSSRRETWDFSMRLFDAYGYVNVCPGHCRMLWEHAEAMASSRARWEDLQAWSTQIERVWSIVDEMIAGAAYDETGPHMALHHAQHAIGIMVSIATNEGREWGGINFPNDGAISNLPRGAIVEGPCIVDARGPVPIAMGELPEPFVGLAHHVINWQELTVDAALSGDERLLYQALLTSPYVHDMQAAKAIMEELLVAHADHMPQFAEQ